MKEEDLILQMLRIRTIEEEIARRYPEGKMRTPVHLSIGQEAAAVGVCSALEPDDIFVSTHRSHAHYLAKGGSVNALMAELYGKSTGCSGGFGGSMHLVSRDVNFYGSTSIVGGTIPVGVGIAFAKKLKKEPGIVVIFHGDAAIEEGVWHESANFAALHKLPVLFVCENNGFSCYTPLKERQPREHFSQVARCYNLNYVLTELGVERIRETSLWMKPLLPAVMEIPCLRFYEHCGPNQEIEYPKDERRERFLPEIEAAFRFAEDSPWPEPMEMYA